MRYKDLYKVILLHKGFLLTRLIKEDQGTLISIFNYSPHVNKRRITPVKLILYTSLTTPLSSFPRHPLLHRLASN
jgi:hypothetical protein